MDSFNEGRTPTHLSACGFEDLWKNEWTGRDIRVAIFDSGIDNTEGYAREHLGHWRLRENEGGVSQHFDFTEAVGRPELDEFGHGTKVAGVLAAGRHLRPESRYGPCGIIGSAPECRLHSYKVVKRNGEVAKRGLDAALEKILGVARERRPQVALIPLEGDFWKYEPDRLAVTVERLAEAGILSVLPAGDSPKGGREPEPGIRPKTGLLLVGGTGRETGGSGPSITPTSNHGAAVDLYAPSEEIPTVTPMGLTRISGTSAAAAIVAGAVACLLSTGRFNSSLDVAGFLKGACKRQTESCPAFLDLSPALSHVNRLRSS